MHTLLARVVSLSKDRETLTLLIIIIIQYYEFINEHKTVPMTSGAPTKAVAAAIACSVAVGSVLLLWKLQEKADASDISGTSTATKGSAMSFFSDVKLIHSSDGSPAAPPTVTTALLFSSSWCPDCTPFVARLGAMYEDINEDEQQFEVVFVSSDRDAALMGSYMASKHPGWLAVSYDDPARNEFKRKFGCCAGSEKAQVGVDPRKYGIPALVIIKPDGSVIRESGKAEVESYRGGNELPSAWK